jgi:hypothetical protein
MATASDVILNFEFIALIPCFIGLIPCRSCLPLDLQQSELTIVPARIAALAQANSSAPARRYIPGLD